MNRNMTIRTPYLWRADGTGVPLPLLDGDTNGAVAAMAGEWAVDFGNGVRWRLTGSGTPQPVRLAAGPGNGAGMAADGTLVAGTGTSATLWRGAGPAALPLPAGFNRYAVGGISADGRVITGLAAMRERPNGGRPLLWVCGA
jgi:hypothetical protein